MADAKTERVRAITTDLDGMRKEWFDAGVKAGAEAERARIRAVEEQSMRGHEELIASLMFDGKTTGGEAAIQVLAAERKRRGIVEDFRTPETISDSASESSPMVTQKVDKTMSEEQVAAIAQQEWRNNPKLHREFTGEAGYVAFRIAEASGRIRILDTSKGI